MGSEFIEFEYLVDAVKALPGVGTKGAKKIAHFLLRKDWRFIDEFIKRLNTAREEIRECKVCGNWARDERCAICDSPNREKGKLCIVATVDDLMSIEACAGFNGKYHVLGGELSKAKNVAPEHLNLKKIPERVVRERINEVLIATNLTPEGESTANYIKLQLRDFDIGLYRIAFGLPVNSQIDYADDMTLKFAIQNKSKIG